MTWDSSWKDIIDLEGLKRQPFKAEYHNDLVNALCERYSVANAFDDFEQRGIIDRNTFNFRANFYEYGALPFNQPRFAGIYGAFYPFMQQSSIGEVNYYLDDNIKNDPSGINLYTFISNGGFGNVTTENFMASNGYYAYLPNPYYGVDGGHGSLDYTSMRYMAYSSHMIWLKQMLKYCKIPTHSIRYINWNNGANFDVSPLYLNGVESSLAHRCTIYRTKSYFDNTLVPWVTLDDGDTTFVDPYYGSGGFDTNYADYTYTTAYNDRRIGYLHRWRIPDLFGFGFFAIALIDNIAFEYV